MSLNPVQKLILLHDHPDAFLTQHDLDRWPISAERWLIENDWLVAASPAADGATIPCPECDDGHPVTIELATIGDQTFWIAACKRLGALKVASQDLYRWRPSCMAFVKAVAHGLKINEKSIQQIETNRLWVLGHRAGEAEVIRIAVGCGQCDLCLLPTHTGPTVIINFGHVGDRRKDSGFIFVDGVRSLEWSSQEGVIFNPDEIYRMLPTSVQIAQKKIPDSR